MDADRPRESLTGAGIDRELQALLAVDPSPGFAARVRTRIASEPEPRAWWWSWTFATLTTATAVAVIVLAMVATRSGPVQTVAGPKGPALHVESAGPKTAESAGPKGPALQPPVREPAGPKGPALQARIDTPRTGPRRPGPLGPGAADIVIDPRESAALRALIFGVRAGTVDLQPVLRASAPSAMELPPIGEIAIAPITIDPLEEGVRQ